MKETYLSADAAAASAAENPWEASSAQGSGSVPANGAEVPASAEAANPWQALDGPGAQPQADAADAGDAWLNMNEAAPDAGNWLDGAAGSAAAPADTGFHLAQLWDGSLPVQDWINDALAWFVLHFRPFFQMLRVPIDSALTSVESALQAMPLPVMMVIVGLLAWQLAGRAVAVLTVVFMLIIGVLGVWQEAMVTLALVLTSLVFCIVIGLPLGIGLAASDRAERISRPVLDAMQTTPAFVYLVPVVMLFGIGNVPGVIVTIVFALPPLVRLTSLGIRQVRPDLIEASHAYGASPWQVLLKVQLPLAMPSIMAGINQALMLALSMVVIASMIAVGGLGQMVLRGIGRLDMGLATVGGLGIVLLAIALDRITQAVGQHSRGKRHWYEGGPVGLFWRMFARRRSAPAATHAAEGR